MSAPLQHTLETESYCCHECRSHNRGCGRLGSSSWVFNTSDGESRVCVRVAFCMQLSCLIHMSAALQDTLEVGSYSHECRSLSQIHRGPESSSWVVDTFKGDSVPELHSACSCPANHTCQLPCKRHGRLFHTVMSVCALAMFMSGKRIAAGWLSLLKGHFITASVVNGSTMFEHAISKMVTHVTCKPEQQHRFTSVTPVKCKLPSLPSWTSLLMATLAFSIVHTATDSPLHREANCISIHYNIIFAMLFVRYAALFSCSTCHIAGWHRCCTYFCTSSKYTYSLAMSASHHSLL